MKTLINVLLILTALMVLAGCGGSGDSSPQVAGWAVGSINGATAKYPAVLHTANGTNWDEQRVFYGYAGWGVRDVSAVDARNVWLTLNTPVDNSGGRVFKSLDSGTNWIDVSPTEKFTDGASWRDSVVGIRMLTAATGYVVGSKSMILKTTDGGVTWHMQTVNGVPADSIFTVVTTIDEQTAWAAGGDANGYPICARTTDGVTWNKCGDFPVNNGGYRILGIHAASASMLWATQQAGNVYQSQDGGQTWQEIVSVGALSDANNVCTIGDQYVWACGDKGNVVRSNNRGVSFEHVDAPELHRGGYILDVNAVDANHVWIVGSNEDGTHGHLLYSDKGGTTWNEMTPPMLDYDLWRISLVGGSK